MIPIHEFRQTVINTIEELLKLYQLYKIQEFKSQIFDGNETNILINRETAIAYLNSAQKIEKAFMGETSACDFIKNKITHMLATQDIATVVNQLEKQLKKIP